MVNNLNFKSLLAICLIVFIGSISSCSIKDSKLDPADTTKVKKDSLKNISGNHIKTNKTIVS